jgi:hypothetical protein
MESAAMTSAQAARSAFNEGRALSFLTAYLDGFLDGAGSKCPSCTDLMALFCRINKISCRNDFEKEFKFELSFLESIQLSRAMGHCLLCAFFIALFTWRSRMARIVEFLATLCASANVYFSPTMLKKPEPHKEKHVGSNELSVKLEGLAGACDEFLRTHPRHEDASAAEFLRAGMGNKYVTSKTDFFLSNGAACAALFHFSALPSPPEDSSAVALRREAMTVLGELLSGSEPLESFITCGGARSLLVELIHYPGKDGSEQSASPRREALKLLLSKQSNALWTTFLCPCGSCANAAPIGQFFSHSFFDLFTANGSGLSGEDLDFLPEGYDCAAACNFLMERAIYAIKATDSEGFTIHEITYAGQRICIDATEIAKLFEEFAHNCAGCAWPELAKMFFETMERDFLEPIYRQDGNDKLRNPNPRHHFRGTAPFEKINKHRTCLIKALGK